jgi:hypothetical protein
MSLDEHLYHFPTQNLFNKHFHQQAAFSASGIARSFGVSAQRKSNF